MLRTTSLGPGNSKCSPWTSSISIIRKPVRNADGLLAHTPDLPNQNLHSAGDVCARSSLRRLVAPAQAGKSASPRYRGKFLLCQARRLSPGAGGFLTEASKNFSCYLALRKSHMTSIGSHARPQTCPSLGHNTRRSYLRSGFQTSNWTSGCTFHFFKEKIGLTLRSPWNLHSQKVGGHRELRDPQIDERACKKNALWGCFLGPMPDLLTYLDFL